MLPNPYTPDATPRMFVGREDELDQVRARLDGVVQYGEMSPLMVFTAPRGQGKTSLLRRVAEDAQHQGFVTVWVSCVSKARFLPDLVQAVDRSLRRAELTSDRWASRLETLTVEVGVPGAKVSTGFRTRGATPEPQISRVGAVESLLHEAAVAVRGRGGAGVLVLLDELHAPDLTDTAVLLNALQNLSGERAVNPLAVIGAGLPATPEHLTKAATFAERTTFAALPRLGPRASADALIAPAAEVGVPWSTTALAVAEGHADGYPYLLQLFGAATWDAARPDPGTTLTEAHVIAGSVQVATRAGAMFRARWGTATPMEREFIAAMANHPDERVPRADIASIMGRTTAAISVVRNRLIDRGIIEPAGHGLLRFTIPGFDAYVRNDTDAPPPATPPPPPARALTSGAPRGIAGPGAPRRTGRTGPVR